MKAHKVLLPALLMLLAACSDAADDPVDVAAADRANGGPTRQPGHVWLTINPFSATLEEGMTLQFRVIVRNPMEVSTPVTWSSSDDNVATVDANGLVTAESPGAATITAYALGASRTAQVTVRLPAAPLTYAGRGWRTVMMGAGLAPIYDVWGSSAADVFAVGSSMLWDCCATIQHYDGKRWYNMPVPDGVLELFGVWGSSGSDVFAVGDRILHYDGYTWSTMAAPVQGAPLAVWGSSGSDVFAVGPSTILHYDGSRWTEMQVPSYGAYDVWGSSSSDVFAVGELILHYDGRAWSEMPAPPHPTLFSVWGTSGRNVYAVGHGGTILRYDGTSWKTESMPVRDGELLAVWGTSPSDVFAVGDQRDWGPGDCCSAMIHFDGTAWRSYDLPTHQSLFGIWGMQDRVFIVGSGPTIIQGAR